MRRARGRCCGRLRGRRRVATGAAAIPRTATRPRSRRRRRRWRRRWGRRDWIHRGRLRRVRSRRPVRAISVRWSASRAGSTMVSPVMLRSGAVGRPWRVGLEGEQCLAERAGVGGDDEADFGHLSASVGAGFVVHDDDVVEQQDAGSDGSAGPAGELFGPFQGAAAELEAVEIDAAEPEHCGAEHVAQRPRLLFDHAVVRRGCAGCRARWSWAGRAGRTGR